MLSKKLTKAACPEKLLKRSGGFTLLEILLVVGIIAVLAGIVIIAINPTRQLATVRNTERKSDLKQINSAIQQFYIDHSFYPASTTDYVTSLVEICDTGSRPGPQTDGADPVTCTDLVDLSELVPVYVTAIPVDPSGPVVAFLDQIITKVYAAVGGTGYWLGLENNKVVLTAPQAELDAMIAIGTSTATTPGEDELVDGVCGSSATTYASDATDFTGSLCSAGTADPLSPTFPDAGDSVSWVCDGANGGSTSGTCTATRDAEVALGCDVTVSGASETTDGAYTIQTFTGDGSFTVDTGTCDVDVLVVAGGGAGGSSWGGGGGGGGVIEATDTLTSNIYDVFVGAGGLYHYAAPYTGYSGEESSFNGHVAVGGGGGGGSGSSPGVPGGSGGGGGYNNGGGAEGAFGQGFNGGNAMIGGGFGAAGGGGGASATGNAGTGTSGENLVAGAGGEGITSSISGTPYVYGSGGGGSASNQNTATPPTGGLGGSGGGQGGLNSTSAGWVTSQYPTDATGYGGGGGGSLDQSVEGSIGDGYQGVVIIRYQ